MQSVRKPRVSCLTLLSIIDATCDSAQVHKNALAMLSERKAVGYCIAVDFDGTICYEDIFPKIGNPNLSLIHALIRLRSEFGIKLILWTCRENASLQEALTFCEKYGLSFDAVNDNLSERQTAYHNNPRKIGADEYLDDKNI